MFGKKSSSKTKTSSATKSTSKKPVAKKPKKAKTVSKTQTQELAEYIRHKRVIIKSCGLAKIV